MARETMWAIWHPTLRVMCGTALTRRDAIVNFVASWSGPRKPPMSWRECRSRGYRAIKVAIVYKPPEPHRPRLSIVPDIEERLRLTISALKVSPLKEGSLLDRVRAAVPSKRKKVRRKG